MEDLLQPNARENCVENILYYLYNPISNKHAAVVYSICKKLNVNGFRHNSEFYYLDDMLVSTVDLKRLPIEYINDWNIHLEWYLDAMDSREKIRWFLSEITSKAKDLKTLYKLLPDGVRAASNVKEMGTTPPYFISMSEEDIVQFKEVNKSRYALVESAALKRMLLNP